MLRVSFHVGHSLMRFQITMCWRCSHVDKQKQPINHISATYQNVEGGGLGSMNVHVPTKHLKQQKGNTKCSIREKVPSIFKNVALGSLKFSFQYNHPLDISLYLTEATAYRHFRELHKMRYLVPCGILCHYNKVLDDKYCHP